MTELQSREARIQTVLQNGDLFAEKNPNKEGDIKSRCEQLTENWNELNNLTSDRYTLCIYLYLFLIFVTLAMW